MPDDIGVEITGLRGTQLRFEQFPEAARQKLKEAVTRLTNKLLELTRADTPVKTGKLRSEIKDEIREGDNYITGNIFFTGEWGKAGALEYGAHKSRIIHAHKAELSHVFAERLAAPMTVSVSLFHRRFNIAAHRMLRDPASSMHDEVLQALQDAVAQTETSNAD